MGLVLSPLAVSSSHAQLAQGVTFLSLDEALRLAWQNNLEIQIAQLDLSIKETDLPSALARYDTDLDIEADFEQDEAEKSSVVVGTKTDTTRLNFALKRLLRFGTTLAMSFLNQRNATNSTFTSVNPHFDTDVEVSLTQPLLKNWAGIVDRSEVEMTRVDIEQFDLDTQDRIEEILAACEEAYWELVREHERVEIKTRALQDAQRFLNINRERIQTGLIEKPDLLAAEANVKQREIEVLIAENSFQSASNELRLKLNWAGQERILPTESPAFEKEVAYLDQSLVTALSARRDYQKAKLEIDEKEVQLTMKRNERWPQLDLEATLTGNGLDRHWEDAVGESYAGDNPTYFVGVSASFPLERSEENAEHARAKFEKARAILEFQQTELKIVTEVESRVRDVNLAAVQADKRLAIESLQKEKLAEEEKKFSYGRSDSDTIIRFQRDVLDASEADLDAAIDHKKALIELSRAQNTLLKKYEKRLDASR